MTNLSQVRSGGRLLASSADDFISQPDVVQIFQAEAAASCIFGMYNRALNLNQYVVKILSSDRQAAAVAHRRLSSLHQVVVLSAILRRADEAVHNAELVVQAVDQYTDISWNHE